MEKGLKGTFINTNTNDLRNFNNLFKYTDDLKIVPKQDGINRQKSNQQKYIKDYKQAVQL